MKEKNMYWIIITITLLILITPLIIRSAAYEGLIPGENAYYHMRIAEYIKENIKIPKNDPLADRIYDYNPFHLLLAAAGYFPGVEFAGKIIPLILGLSSMTFFYLILRELKIEEKKRFFICLILMLSPIFIYTFSTISQFSLITFLNLLGFFFFIKQKKIFITLSIITFASIPYFNFFNALVTLILLFSYTISTKAERKKFYAVSLGITLRTLIYHFYIFYKFGLPQTPSFIKTSIIQNSISDLGALIGFSFFTLVLALVGLIVTWKKKKEFYYIYIISIILIVSSLYFGDYTNIYLNFIIVIMAGFGFFFLTDRKWQIKAIRNASLLLIICGIAFSMVSYIIRFSEMHPYPEEAESLRWLQQNSEQGDVVLSHYSNGFWIEYYAGRKALLDPHFDYINDLEQKYADSKTIFNSRSLDITTKLLDANKIRYIWINKPMKEGLIWKEEDEGLLFLFSDREKFMQAYSNGEAEIWEYLG